MGRIVGIDLGTTFSSIAMLNDVGKPEIIPNDESERITASAIYFDDDNTVFVGREALNSCDRDDKKFARWIKRYMGEEEYPKAINGRKWTPSELSSFILKKLIKDATVQKGEISGGVITVPAYFDEVRRKATMDAGKKAGLNVIGIINEPTAAALYYASEFNISGKTMVFDLGGGTFDVTILSVDDNNITNDVEIICSRGDHRLGGYDFDLAISRKVDLDYEKKYGDKLTDVPEKKNRCELNAEELKKTLSKRKDAKGIFTGKSGNIDFIINREEFETEISPLIARIEMLVEDVLDESNLTIKDISQVILVGGSTRMPVIEKMLSDMFSFPPTKVGNVDECVALGAAIYAGLSLLKEDSTLLTPSAKDTLSKISLQEVCNHSYGTNAVTINADTEMPELANDIIIPKNTKIPKSVTKTYYTVNENQTKINILITQGEGSDLDLVNTLASRTMDLPGGRPANLPVEVTYTYDSNQRMHCVFLDVTSGEKMEIDIDMKDEIGKSTENIEDLFNIE